jgi:hypothetical protein
MIGDPLQVFGKVRDLNGPGDGRIVLDHEK